MVTITDSAVVKFKEFIEKRGSSGDGVRIFLMAGGWSPSLAMDIAKAAQAGDTTLEKDGLKVFLEPRANAMLSGATIDYSDARGFSISNAAPSGTCSPSGGGSCCG